MSSEGATSVSKDPYSFDEDTGGDSAPASVKKSAPASVKRKRVSRVKGNSRSLFL